MIDEPKNGAAQRTWPGRSDGRRREAGAFGDGDRRGDGGGADAPSFDMAGVHDPEDAPGLQGGFRSAALDGPRPALGDGEAGAPPSASAIASRIAAEGDAGDEATTPIDAAWRQAMDAQERDGDPSETARLLDGAAADFIDALLSEPLFCPVWDLEGSHEESLAPKMVERDGVDTLVLFDAEARLAAFAGEPTDYVTLPGRAFFRLLAGQDAQIALNPGVAPSATVFSSETIDAIAELADAVEEETEIMPDGPLTVLSPDDAPDALLRALAARLAAAEPVVAEAWLFTAVQELDAAEEDARMEDPEEFRQLVVGLAAREPRRADALQNLASELSRIGVAAAPGPFTVALFEPDDRLLDVARGVGVALSGGRTGAPTRAA